MRWFSVVFALVSTGSGVALVTVRDIGFAGRCLLWLGLVLGLIIGLPAAIESGREANRLLHEIGFWKGYEEWQRNNAARHKRWLREQEVARARQRRSLTWWLTNHTSETLRIRFFGQNGTWPGRDRSWVLYPGARQEYALECSYEGEHVCYGAASQSGSWGVGIEGAQGCDQCCAYCGPGSVGTRLVYE